MTNHKLRRIEDGTMIARLPDGRDLAFKAYGDPDGRPVFYFHGTPSSRYEGSWAAEAAARHNVRLLAIDRPGMGLSSFQQGRTFRHWPHDVGHLADIPLPVHVWAGDQDIFVSNEMVEAMAQRLRHPIIHRLPGKGHLCIEHWEDAFQHVS